MFQDLFKRTGNWGTKYLSKLASMDIAPTWVSTVEKSKLAVKLKGNAVSFQVKNSDNNRENIVTIFLHNSPGENADAWCCGTKCNFWSKVGEDSNYMCKHMVAVVQKINNSAQLREELITALTQTLPVEKQSVDFLKYWKNALFFGPTGSGKTHLVREALQGADVKVFRINISDGLEDVDLLHKLIPDPETKGWKRLQGELRKAFEAAKSEKVVVMLEEITRSTRSLRNLLIKAMDKEEGMFHLHDFTVGETIIVPAENLLFVATGNINNSDTSELDSALARRFPLFVFNDYNISEEKEILRGKGVDPVIIEDLLSITKSIRDQYRAGRLPMPLDTGSLIEWSELIGQGVEVAQAAEMSWLFRVVEKDSMGYPEEGQIAAIKELIEKKGKIG